MVNSPETEKKYERHKDILGTIQGIQKCTGYTIRKFVNFLSSDNSIEGIQGTISIPGVCMLKFQE